MVTWSKKLHKVQRKTSALSILFLEINFRLKRQGGKKFLKLVISILGGVESAINEIGLEEALG